MTLKKQIFTAIFISILGTISSITACRAEDIPDPIEPFNRAMFWVNDKFDSYLLEPVAKGYNYITPKPVQNCVKNFFVNLNSPIYFVSDILQLKFGQSAEHLARFGINSTIGGLGLFDVAASEFNLEHHYEDIGSALGYWGIGQGAYLVLPLLGPSSIRDGVGLLGEAFLNPTVAVTFSDIRQRDKNIIIYGTNTVFFVNQRSRMIETINSAKEASVDYYSFIKHAYQQNRQSVIFDGTPPEEEYDDE